MDKRVFDRLETAGLVVEISQLVVHEGDEPDALAHLAHTYLLAGQRRVSVRARHVAEDERTVDGSRAPRVTGFTRPGPQQLRVLVQQQRILRRSVVIACAVKADALDPPTLREVVAEFLGDISDARARSARSCRQRAMIGERLHFARLL